MSGTELTYCRINEWLPSIPEEMIDSLDVIETREDVFPIPNYSHVYSSYVVGKRLQSWVNLHFDMPVVARYQVIRQQLPVHVDRAETDTKLNYLITTGGPDVRTRWWDSLDEPRNLLYEIRSQLGMWHELDIVRPHDITEITEPRISVTVKRL